MTEATTTAINIATRIPQAIFGVLLICEIWMLCKINLRTGDTKKTD